MTIAQQLKVKEFPFEIKDSKGKQIYSENSTGYWYKREYDSRGKVIYYEDSTGTWIKWEYDSNGKQIYYESSTGYIEDDRPKEVILTMDEIAQRLNIPVSQLKIKK